jgi:hypothetical protein
LSWERGRRILQAHVTAVHLRLQRDPGQRRACLPDVTKLGGVIGGVIGAVLLIWVSFYVGDRIAWTARQSDYAGTAVAVAAGVVGWVAGSRIARRLLSR